MWQETFWETASLIEMQRIVDDLLAGESELTADLVILHRVVVNLTQIYSDLQTVLVKSNLPIVEMQQEFNLKLYAAWEMISKFDQLIGLLNDYLLWVQEFKYSHVSVVNEVDAQMDLASFLQKHISETNYKIFHTYRSVSTGVENINIEAAKAEREVKNDLISKHKESSPVVAMRKINDYSSLHFINIPTLATALTPVKTRISHGSNYSFTAKPLWYKTAGLKRKKDFVYNPIRLQQRLQIRIFKTVKPIIH